MSGYGHAGEGGGFFDYFAYGSCMCPVDLKRSLGEPTHSYVVGAARLPGYRLGFYHYLSRRNCGALDIVADPGGCVEGVLYRLPVRLADRLDEREGVAQGDYRHQTVSVVCGGQVVEDVRTYVVVNKLSRELAPNDWYASVVLRGALTCRLSEQYCWQLFDHMHRLQVQLGTADLVPVAL
jgi:cation transport regulator ChaC